MFLCWHDSMIPEVFLSQNRMADLQLNADSMLH